MAKTDLTDYSTDAANNTDIGGVGITDSDPGSNLRDAQQQMAAAIARWQAGDAPVSDAAVTQNEADNSKTFRTTGENIPVGTERILDVEALYRNGAYIETIYTASGTHTFEATSRFFQIEAVGGGGGGGGVDGQGAATKAAASGGTSGFFGRTSVLERGAIATGAVVIGTGGAGGAGASGTNGSVGVATTWVDSTNSFTWAAGRGGIGIVAAAGFEANANFPLRPGAGAGLIGSSDGYTIGLLQATTPPKAFGGPGGSSPWGQGGRGGDTSAGSDASGYGSGGGGASVYEVATNFAGGAGSAGILIVREW